jgi:hypothetical protein
MFCEPTQKNVARSKSNEAAAVVCGAVRGQPAGLRLLKNQPNWQLPSGLRGAVDALTGTAAPGTPLLGINVGAPGMGVTPV